MTAPNPHNPLQVVVSIWRSILATFFRMPLLVLGSFLLYVLVSGYWQHSLPFNIPRGLASQAGYELLHAAVFAPLILAVIQMIARQNIRYADIWTTAAISVGAVIAIHEFGILLETSMMRAVKSGIDGQQFFSWYTRGDIEKLMLIYRLYAVIGAGLLIGVFLLSIRLALLVPIVALEETGWRTALVKAWRGMRGNYGFALAVSCAALLPLLVADHFLTRLYRVFYTPYVSPALSLRDWEALMVRSSQLTLGYIMTAALVAWLYRAIAGRRSTAPSL